MVCKKTAVLYTLLSLFSLFSPFSTFAQTLPLWELGMATGYASLPYYRGSASGRDIVLPMPLAVYRGQDLRLDEEGARKSLFSSKNLRLEMSLAGGLPVPDDGSSVAREGMPSLDATLEFGPNLRVRLWKKRNHSLSFYFPLRAVSALSFRKVDLHGWVFTPYIHYVTRQYKRNGWEFQLSIGPQYGSERFHSYYYSVSRAYETNSRNAYEASAGYSGSRVTMYFQKTINRLWLSAFARYDDLSGASFIDSPLVEQDHSLISGFVIGWIFAKSPQRVYFPY